MLKLMIFGSRRGDLNDALDPIVEGSGRFMATSHHSWMFLMEGGSSAVPASQEIISFQSFLSVI